MLSGFLGIFPAWLGDRKKALQFFSKANLEFFCDPFYQCTEYAMTSDEQHKPYGIVTPFLTGRGSLLSGLMMGLTRLSIWHDNVDDWLVVRARLIRLRKCACTDRRASLSLARARHVAVACAAGVFAL